MLLRLAFRRTPQNQWKQLGQLLSINDGFHGEVGEVKVSDLAATEEPFQIEYKIAQPNYLDWSSKKSQFALPLPAFGLPVASEDSEDFELGTPLDIAARVELELPAKHAARAPVSVAVMRDYAEYRSTYKVEGNRVLAEAISASVSASCPRRARETIWHLLAQSIAVEATTAGAPTIPETAKTDELYEAGIAALRNGNIPTAVELRARR